MDSAATKMKADLAWKCHMLAIDLSEESLFQEPLDLLASLPTITDRTLRRSPRQRLQDLQRTGRRLRDRCDLRLPKRYRSKTCWRSSDQLPQGPRHSDLTTIEVDQRSHPKCIELLRRCRVSALSESFDRQRFFECADRFEDLVLEEIECV
ncbi:unannotated protein [freshwater metagenome]|uniref:Unannotated protein n=1 Tax=freshwater metagenome TaxID=449393 RepID=A0A6J6E4S6_9ZZZZ